MIISPIITSALCLQVFDDRLPTTLELLDPLPRVVQMPGHCLLDYTESFESD